MLHLPSESLCRFFPIRIGTRQGCFEKAFSLFPRNMTIFLNVCCTLLGSRTLPGNRGTGKDFCCFISLSPAAAAGKQICAVPLGGCLIFFIKVSITAKTPVERFQKGKVCCGCVGKGQTRSTAARCALAKATAAQISEASSHYPKVRALPDRTQKI